MAKIKWLIEKQVVFIDGDLSLSRDEAIEMNRQINHLLDAGVNQTHLLFDVRHIKQFPTSMTWLQQNITFIHHPKIGINVTITENRVLRFLGAVVYKTHGKWVPKFVSDYAQAVKILENIDPSLPKLPESVD